MSDGLERLINPWTMTITVNDTERPQHFPPLVDMLHKLVVPSNNSHGGGGAPNTRNLIDPKSLDLLIHIQDVTRAWLQEWKVPAAGEIKLDLRGYWDKLNNLHTSGVMDDDTFEHLATYPDTWAAKIWDLIEPPKQIPLRGTGCPKCGADKVTNAEGEASDNITITFRVGHEPTAECRNTECHAVWIGRTGLIDLGRSIDTDIDVEEIMKVVAEMS